METKHPPNAEGQPDVCNESGPCSKYPNCPCPIGPAATPNAPGPSAEEVLSADDKRLLTMLRGEWNNEADGYWPAVDAMDEAARVIDRLAARLAEARKDLAAIGIGVAEDWCPADNEVPIGDCKDCGCCFKPAIDAARREGK